MDVFLDANLMFGWPSPQKKASWLLPITSMVDDDNDNSIAASNVFFFVNLPDPFGVRSLLLDVG